MFLPGGHDFGCTGQCEHSLNADGRAIPFRGPGVDAGRRGEVDGKAVRAGGQGDVAELVHRQRLHAFQCRAR